MSNLEKRKRALKRELERRQAKKSTSELQAAYVLGANRLLDAVLDERDDDRDDEDRDGERDGGVWGVDDAELGPLDGDSASRRQAAYVTRRSS